MFFTVVNANREISCVKKDSLFAKTAELILRQPLERIAMIRQHLPIGVRRKLPFISRNMQVMCTADVTVEAKANQPKLEPQAVLTALRAKGYTTGKAAILNLPDTSQKAFITLYPHQQASTDCKTQESKLVTEELK